MKKQKIINSRGGRGEGRWVGARQAIAALQNAGRGTWAAAVGAPPRDLFQTVPNVFNVCFYVLLICYNFLKPSNVFPTCSNLFKHVLTYSTLFCFKLSIFFKRFLTVSNCITCVSRVAIAFP